MDLPRLADMDVAGKRVLVRADLNVPLKDGRIADDSRIRAAMPTFRDVLDRGGRLVVAAHLGRPRGRRDPDDSLRPVADALREALNGATVAFAEDCVGKAAEQAVARLGDGDCLVLENLRFHPGETDNAPDFAAALAGLADLYVNDAFSASHRAHASIVGVPERLPAAAGHLMETELASLGQLLGDPHRPFVAILGGAKPETKLPVIEHLLDRADRILLGGVMATTFLKARGMEIGRSRVGDDVEGARRLLDAAESARAELFLPDDVVVAEAPRADAETETVEATAVPADGMILDIGPRTIERYAEAIGEEGAKVWNGTLGAEEFEPFQTGSHFLAAALGERTAIGDAGRFVSVVGGGDTVAFVAKHQFAHLFSYVSMAGGALLHWLSGRPLPGVEALRGDRTAP